MTDTSGAPRRRIAVRVRPGAGKRAVDVSEAGNLTVSVASPPEGGRANREVVELLAEHFGLPPSRVRIVRGGRSRLKLVELEGR